MDPKDLGILGAACSAIVAALSYWAKTRHERRRATRTVLYYLLELHHVVHRLRAASKALDSEFIRELTTAFHSRGVTISESDATAALELVGPLISEFGRVQIEGTVAAITNEFSKGLADLAREDPILAFRLRGRDQLMLLPQKIQGFVAQNSSEDMSATEENRDNMSSLDDLLLRLAIEELHSAIRATAWNCDLLTHVRTTLLLRRSAREESSGELKEIVTRFVDDYTSSLGRKSTLPAQA